MRSKRKPSWDDLQIFLEISRHASLHAASKKLGIDHATVCRHLARVEAAFGVKLVDRNRNGVLIRPEAEALLRHIEHMELHAQLMLESAEASNDRLKTVRIATMEGIASGYISHRIPLLRDAHPNIRIELVSTPIAIDVGKREADIFLSFFKPPSKLLRSTKIGEFALHLYCSKTYVGQRGMPRSRDELRDHDYVGYIKELLAIEAVRWLEDLVPSPHMTFHSNSILAQRSAALAGMGIAMLPTFVAQDSPDLQVILPDDFIVKREVWLSLAVDPEFLSPIRAVTAFLAKIFEADRELLLRPGGEG